MNDIIRKQMKDVIVPHNEVIRRVPTVPEPYAAPKPSEEMGRIEKNPFFKKERKKDDEPPKGKSARSHALTWAFLAVALLVAVFVVANYFSSATVEITPITRSINLDRDFTAVSSDKAVEGDLIFHFVATSTEKIKEVPATVEKKIQKKASGKVTIFNSYNGESQRLIKNTRLESPGRKTYRIDQSVIVPGMKVVNGKNMPGSVEAVVYADAPGPDYNIDKPADFTIPGFNGDPRYTKFYARSKPDSPITGGFSGTVNIPSDEAILLAQEELKQELPKIAIEKARAQIPDGMSLFPGGVIIKFEDVPQDITLGTLSKVVVRATASVFFFDTTVLTEKLAAALLSEDKGKTFVVSNMSALAFSFVDPVNNVVLSDLSKISFHIKGDLVFVGQIDATKIRAELAGKEKKDFGKLIVGENSIGKADVVIRPMWKTAFPKDPTKITIKIVSGE
ncbi:MAG: hypothetical protein HZB11_01470 [Candidatus Yonathbacteria bacterium]|nr:hypothetical protein [Candidatus Yonathbacteria bacterium]